jgi:hypothetical protein
MNKKIIIGIMFILGIVFLSNIYAENTITNTYTINETGELVINANTDNEIIIDYSRMNNSYMRTFKGRYIDRKTGLDFKNRFFYLKFKNEGKIYKRYVRSNNNIYYTGIEYYLQYYNLYHNGKQVQIITGVYQQ